jgi:hypothetical protein
VNAKRAGADWLTFRPLQIKGVIFTSSSGSTSSANSWSAVSDTGGEAEILGISFVGPTDCSGFGGAFCTYPFYARNGSDQAFTFGGDYPAPPRTSARHSSSSRRRTAPAR